MLRRAISSDRFCRRLRNLPAIHSLSVFSLRFADCSASGGAWSVAAHILAPSFIAIRNAGGWSDRRIQAAGAIKSPGYQPSAGVGQATHGLVNVPGEPLPETCRGNALRHRQISCGERIEPRNSFSLSAMSLIMPRHLHCGHRSQ